MTDDYNVVRRATAPFYYPGIAILFVLRRNLYTPLLWYSTMIDDS